MRRIVIPYGVVIGVLLIAVMYVGLADAGMNVPFGRQVREIIDQQGASVLRPLRNADRICREAAQSRHELFYRLKSLQSSDQWIKWSFSPEVNKGHYTDIWTHAQTLTALFSMPEATSDDLRPLLGAIDILFAREMRAERGTIKYGWISNSEKAEVTYAIPALWIHSALAIALGRIKNLSTEDEMRYKGYLLYTQEVLANYRPAGFRGGWCFFPLQDSPSAADPYTSALALQSMLELKRYDLPWENSVKTRDELIQSTSDWLMSHFDGNAPFPGWRGVGESRERIFEGLTLYIYSLLMRAEDFAGIKISSNILSGIPRHLSECVARQYSYPVQSAEFRSLPFVSHKNITAITGETVTFLWYPWAIDCAVRWLRRSQKYGSAAADVTRVQRALGHLIVDLKDDALSNGTDGLTYEAAENLYGLAEVTLSHDKQW